MRNLPSCPVRVRARLSRIPDVRRSKNSLTRLYRSISPPLDARRSTAGRARHERARSIATCVATYAGCACVRASVGPSLLHTPPQPVALAAAHRHDSCPPSRARRRRHARARCAPSRGIVWRKRPRVPFLCGSSTNPPLSLFSSRVVWSYGKKKIYEFAVEIPHAPHPRANQRNPRAMRPLTPAHRRPLALLLVCRAERPARVAARDPRARSPARRRPVDRRERGAPLAFFLVPIGTVHHESGNQRESALSTRRTAPFPRLK